MLVELLKSKIHRAVVTEANLNYVGSVTIDTALMEEAGILCNEKVLVVNIDSGSRFETYVIPGEKDSGVICLNGAAARLVQPGDKVIIMSFVSMEIKEAKGYKPVILLLDEGNKVISKINSESHGEIF